MKKTVVITGASSGIGKAACRIFADRGHKVYGISRRGTGDSDIIHISADVTDSDSLDRAFSSIDNIDVLVNCAGMGISGAVEFTDEKDAKKQMDVNFFGTFNTIKAALPLLRKSSCPSIINVSSVGGPLAIPFQAFYSASKAAINALTLALANELKPFGIAVCAVMPGDISTGFTDARIKNEQGEELYGQTIENAVSSMEHDERNGMSPAVIAEKIYRLSEKRNPKVLSTAGSKYKMFMFLYHILPQGFVNMIVGKLYR